MMRYKLVIFDFDGTLADSVSWFVGVVNQVADRFGFKKVDAAEFDELRGYESGQVLKQLGVPMWKLPMIGTHMKALMAKDIQKISLFKGVDDLLRRLAESGMTLAIVSSNSKENVHQVLGPDNAALIRHYECGAALFGKQTKFRKILRKCGVLPSEAICIGDEIRDIKAAHGEGIAFGAVSWGYAKIEAFRAHSPAVVFGSIEEIVAKLT